MLHMDSCVMKAIMQVAMYVSVSSGMKINWLLTKNNRNGLREALDWIIEHDIRRDAI
jgi:hypothetical protein